MIIQKIDNFIYNKFRELIYQWSGIRFSEINRSSLETKISSCSNTLKCKDVYEYYEFVSENRKELETLVSAITTNLTSFFRTLIHFSALKNLVLPELILDKKTRNLERCIRIWSAGCSTGEEPYSLAIWLSEYLPSGFKFKIFATDISLPCLYNAQKGEYNILKCQGIEPKLLKKYCTLNSQTYTINPSVKKHVMFDYSNLVTNNQLLKFDIVCCRNVMIYFDLESQKKLVNNLYNAMESAHSYLFLGHTESLESIYNTGLPKDISHTSYITIYRRKG